MSRQVRGHAAFLIFFGPTQRVHTLKEEESAASLTERQTGYSGAESAFIPFCGSEKHREMRAREWRANESKKANGS
jgi:hypothetical protein